MNLIPDQVPAITSRLTSDFAHLPHKYIGVSGAALLWEALRQENRRTLILPAFICPELSVMGVKTGMRVIHVDVDRRTMHMVPELLEECLKKQRDADTVVLVDHTFGYPYHYVAELRATHPEIVLIEDCVRALGAQIGGQSVGTFGDWVLLSMYKTIRGAECGAVLMTRTPYEMPDGPAQATTFRQLASLTGPLRLLYEFRKKLRPDYRPSPREIESFAWEARRGIPDVISQACFLNEVRSLDGRLKQRRKVAAELTECLRSASNIRLIEPAANGELAGSHLSLTVNDESRDRFLEALHRQAIFLIRAWNTIPAFIKSLRDSFPYGADGSIYLADHVVHIPIDAFLTSSRKKRLLRLILQENF